LAAAASVSGEQHLLAGAGGDEQRRVIVAGAGLAGLATSVALHKVGIPVLVLERETSLRLEGSAIAMWANAFRALDALGVGDALRCSHPLLERTELCSRDGRLLRAFDFNRDCEGGPHEARGMRRSEILEALAAQLPDGSIRFNAAVSSVTADGAVRLQGGETLQGALVVGAEGVRSPVAAQLGVRPQNYAGYSAYRGIASFDGDLPLPQNTIRQVWGEGVRAGMYPISEHEMYWFTCFNAPQDGGPASADDRKQEAYDSVRGWRLGAAEAIEATPAADISRGRLGDRFAYGAVSGRCVLVGDAAHPMTPNLGQGGCTALEDGVVLARALQQLLRQDGSGGGGVTATAVEGALRQYETDRRKRVLPLTLRSHAFGRLLQLSFPPVCAVRNLYVEKGFNPTHFLSHAAFDCGSLEH
jgi:2-polyprenyl-6-methoxyphenol hydroxylase-like FAD-dependent oxidoreductase